MKKIKILFLAIPYSSHTHSWVELFQDHEKIDARVFATDGWAQDYFKPRVYSSQHIGGALKNLSEKLPLAGFELRFRMFISSSSVHMLIHKLKEERNSIFSMASFNFFFKSYTLILLNLMKIILSGSASQETLRLIVLSMIRKMGDDFSYDLIAKITDSETAVDIFLSLHEQNRQKWLLKLISSLKPDIVHTLGFDPAGFHYLPVHNQLSSHKPYWIHTSRGGPELAWGHLNEKESAKLKEVILSCDLFVADNTLNYEIALKLGAKPDKFISEDSSHPEKFYIFPGTGGVDFESLRKFRTFSAHQSRTIVFPKAYECPASKALPVLEAILMAWDKIQPCKIVMTAVVPEIRQTLQRFPAEVLKNIEIKDRIERNELLEIIGNSRIVLAPSIIDGIPNTLYESMALGAFPVFSPLETFDYLFDPDKNILFARNLFPEEISEALIRAMTDDDLVKGGVKLNYDLVQKIANRNEIRRKMTEVYLMNSANEYSP